jgi:hypothetical protein
MNAYSRDLQTLNLRVWSSLQQNNVTIPMHLESVLTIRPMELSETMLWFREYSGIPLFLFQWYFNPIKYFFLHLKK